MFYDAVVEGTNNNNNSLYLAASKRSCCATTDNLHPQQRSFPVQTTGMGSEAGSGSSRQCRAIKPQAAEAEAEAGAGAEAEAEAGAEMGCRAEVDQTVGSIRPGPQRSRSFS